MHISEFKAWFEGFTENIEGVPTKAQWQRISKRVKEIDAQYTPPQVFIDRYWYPYRHYPSYWSTSGTGINAITIPCGATTSNTNQVLANFTAVGQAECASLTTTA